MRPVPFTHWVDLSGWLQRAAYMPPLRITHKIVITTNRGRGVPRPYRAVIFIAP